MKQTIIAASLALITSNAFALDICEDDPDDFLATCPVVATNIGSFVPSKNTPGCILPSKACAGPTIPIEASLVCYAQGWGVMACFAYPTSVEGIFTYNWSIRGDNELPRVGFGPPDATLACSEGTQRITVTVTDIFGQSETVETFGFCRDGYPD
jgi:hypothetical protein